MLKNTYRKSILSLLSISKVNPLDDSQSSVILPSSEQELGAFWSEHQQHGAKSEGYRAGHHQQTPGAVLDAQERYRVCELEGENEPGDTCNGLENCVVEFDGEVFLKMTT